MTHRRILSVLRENELAFTKGILKRKAGPKERSVTDSKPSKKLKHTIYLDPKEEEAFACKFDAIEGHGKPFDDTIDLLQNYLRHTYNLSEEKIREGVAVKSSSPNRSDLDEEEKDGLTILQALVSFDGRTVDEKLATLPEPSNSAESKLPIALPFTTRAHHVTRTNQTRSHIRFPKKEVRNFRFDGMAYSRANFVKQISKWQEEGVSQEYIWRNVGGITTLIRDLLWLSRALYCKYNYVQKHPECQPRGLEEKSCLRLRRHHPTKIYLALTALYEYYPKGWHYGNAIVNIPRDLADEINIREDLTHNPSWFSPHLQAPVSLTCNQFFNIVDEPCWPVSIKFKSRKEMDEIIKEAKKSLPSSTEPNVSLSSSSDSQTRLRPF